MISIITPCYNSSKKIDLLIESLVNQDSTDFEWIIVDDCSDKNDFEITKNKVSKTNINYKIIRNKNNSGPGISRNNGIKIATGDYVTFIDSDDFVSKDFISTLIVCKNEVKCDTILFNAVKLKNGIQNKFIGFKNINEGFISLNESLINAPTCVWGGLYSKECIIKNNITFPNIKRFEDFVFRVSILMSSNNIFYLDKELYYYVDNDTSIVHTFKTNGYECATTAINLLQTKLLYEDKNLYYSLFLQNVIYTFLKEKIMIQKLKEVRLECKNLFNTIPPKKFLSLIKPFPKYQKIILILGKMRLLLLLKIILKNLLKR